MESDRAFAANVLGTLAQTVVDRVTIGAEAAAGHGAAAPAALVTLLWYPDRPITFLAARLRITRARMLLETGYLTVEAIAEACGWRDAAMFRRIFREATGTTPSAYRERFRLRGRRRNWGADLPGGASDTGTARRPTDPIR